MIQNTQKKTPEQMVEAIFAMDLDPIKFKLMDKDEGYGWTRAEADRHELEYRRFLALIAKYPDEVITPTKSVDRFWHGHILDTMKYAEDCNGIFGYFVHHFPYFGMRDAEDVENAARAAAETKRLYAMEFGGAIHAEKGNAYCAKTAASYCAKASSEVGAQAEEAQVYCAKANMSYCAKASDKAGAQAEEAQAYCAKANMSYCAKASDKTEAQAEEAQAYCAKANMSYCAKASDKVEAQAEEARAYCAKSSMSYCAKASDNAYCAKASSQSAAESSEVSAYCAKTSESYCARTLSRSDAIVTGKGRPSLKAVPA